MLPYIRPLPSIRDVSILTRPYGRMLSHQRRGQGLHGLFQSSPALTGGCYDTAASAPRPGCSFQSSPALTGGCYSQLALQRHIRRRSFNPHPPLRADAIHLTMAIRRLALVSILTRPYGRMLSLRPQAYHLPLLFQSSPALTGGCYMQRAPRIAKVIESFNPHPPLRADAILDASENYRAFEVSILTRPYGRMLSSPSSQSETAAHGFNPHPPLRADAIRGRRRPHFH